MNGIGLLALMGLVFALIVVAGAWRRAVLDRDEARAKQRELGRRLLARSDRRHVVDFARRAA